MREFGNRKPEKEDNLAAPSRILAHQLGQSLMGLGADLVALKIIAEHSGMPEDLRLRIDEVRLQAERHLGNAERIVHRIRNEEV